MPVLVQPIKKIQTGAAMVEFAIVLPFLLLLVIGICEFGFGFYHLNILNKSVQDGARYFSDPANARKGNLLNAIDISTSNPAVAQTQCLVIFGNTAGTGSPLMPNTGSCTTSTGNPLAVGNYTITVTTPVTDHIRVTAAYQHNFILGTAFSGIASMFGSTGNIISFNLSASSVLRVE